MTIAPKTPSDPVARTTERLEDASPVGPAAGAAPGERAAGTWRREAEAVWTAFAFLTRLPSPRRLPGEGAVERAVGWLPLVGAVVGGAAAWAYAMAGLLWPSPLPAIAAVAAAVLVTGGFHEDGLADTADAFASGGDRERMLAVMDDPRIGAVGAVALVLVLLGRVAALAALAPAVAIGALIAAHALARWSVTALLWELPYVRGEGGVAARLARGATAGRLALATVLAAASLAAVGVAVEGPLASALKPAVAAAAAALAVALALGAIFRRRLGGVTGDLLGTCCQAVELAVLLAVLAVVGPV